MIKTLIKASAMAAIMAIAGFGIASAHDHPDNWNSWSHDDGHWSATWQDRDRYRDGDGWHWDSGSRSYWRWDNNTHDYWRWNPRTNRWESFQEFRRRRHDSWSHW